MVHMPSYIYNTRDYGDANSTRKIEESALWDLIMEAE